MSLHIFRRVSGKMFREHEKAEFKNIFTKRFEIYENRYRNGIFSVVNFYYSGERVIIIV